MKRKIFLCAITLLLFTFSICFANEFNDVPKDHWAYEYINKLSNDGIINGFEDGSFRPSETLTKAQFIKLMVSSDKLHVQNMNELLSNYNDNSKWYDSYFDVAEEYYLLPNGYEKNDLNSPISRKDMAEILSNFIKFVSFYTSIDNNEQAKLKQELDNNPEFINNAFSEYLSELDTKLNNSFEDVLNLDKRSQENIFIVKDLGIISGYEDGTFRPYNYVTRAEASKVLSKYIDETSVGIIIFNETQNVIADATNQLDVLAIQMFNSRFEDYAGTRKNKSIANLLVSMIISSNNSLDNKVSIELTDTNGQSIIDALSIKNAINSTSDTTFDISFQKDSNGYINHAIIKSSTPINNIISTTDDNASNTNDI